MLHYAPVSSSCEAYKFSEGLGKSKKIINILGASGSIGRATCSVLQASPHCFEVGALAVGEDVKALVHLVRLFQPKFVAIADQKAYPALKAALSGHSIEIGAGQQGVIEAALYPADLVISAIPGTAGLLPTYAALTHGRHVALANKESLVCAGALMMKASHKHKALLLPLDSEHNAIFQALGAKNLHELDLTSLEKMTLTASGGPFLRWSPEQMEEATPEMALSHPTWNMGRKVSVDSASLMNKGLELIEAYHLFGIPFQQLEILIHPQSIIHGLVSYKDGSVVAGMAAPDMRVPIAHCLAWPSRQLAPGRRLDLTQIGTLTFEAIPLASFPALRLALQALQTGQGLPNVLNAANEIAVEFFLKGAIKFGIIPRLIEEIFAVFCRQNLQEPQTIEEALELDQSVRGETKIRLQKFLS